MESSPLYNLIQNIEYGTNLHIGVLFFKNYGNIMCELPKRQEIHQNPICDAFKIRSRSSFMRCLRCRNLALKKAVTTKKPFGGLCINGIYEYTHPVIIDNDVACVIFVGNIATDKGICKIKSLDENMPLQTLENSFSLTQCVKVCKTIEGYILYLLEKYPNLKNDENPIIKNIKAYIENNLEFGIDIDQLADTFHYNPRYLGRLFKKETGTTINEYVTLRKLKLAKHLLESTTSTIINISTEVGFSNVTYFNRLFKAKYGITPTEFRKGILKKQ